MANAAGALAIFPGNGESEGRETWRLVHCSAVLLLETRDGWGRGEQEHSNAHLSVL